jgi:Cu+-exporting ATPase
VADVRPDGKAAVIRMLREDGQPAVFVGDGVNDAAALAQADLGMAVGTGTDAAIGAADLTLVGAGQRRGHRSLHALAPDHAPASRPGNKSIK